MAGKYTYYMCYGIVKGKMPKKDVWEIMAKDYESAIRSCKRLAQSNYRDFYHQSTLFYNGHVIGWCFREDSNMIYLDKNKMQTIGLIAKSRN